MVFYKFISLFCCIALWSGVASAQPVADLRTPLEKSGYLQLTSANERSVYLEKIVGYPSKRFVTKLRIVGETIEERPIFSILITGKVEEQYKDPDRLRVLLLSSQHGSEISGCEALLIMLGKYISGLETPSFLDHMELLIVPAVNPDGIENKKRVNAQGINLSTDYGHLSAPESKAVNTLLLEFKPHAVLDIHESALLKKKSLGAEGWLTDFEAQFEYANNPNIDKALQRFTAEIMLPEIINAVNSRGLRAARYISEITSADQVVTHGGLSARNFRNKAGLMGAASFLLENRLDPSTEHYPTPRNIQERVRKQMLCIDTFLKACHEQSKILMELSSAARSALNTQRPVWLQPSYKASAGKPLIEVPLRRIGTGKLVIHRFPYQGEIESGPAFMPPKKYRIIDQNDFIKNWMALQGIQYESCSVNSNDCIVATPAQPYGYLLPLFLEKSSNSSIFERLSDEAPKVNIRSEN